jgi:putative peptidoglycan lipid II flippase
MRKTVLLIIIITIISKVLGFGRDIVLSFFYGTSYISDAYLISQTIPVVILGFIGSGISTGYIPIFPKVVKEKGESGGNNFTNDLLNLILLLSTILIVIVISFTEPVVKLFASGFDEKTLNITIHFTRISIFGIYFTGLNYIFNSYLQIKGNYVIPAFLGFPLNIITIIFIYLSAKTNVYLLVIGGIFAIGSQLIFSLYWAIKKGYTYEFGVDLNNKYIKNLLRVSLPVILGVSVNQINLLVDRTIASRIAVGAISALNYANKLNGFVQGIFVTTLVTVMYPLISKMIVNNNFNGLKQSVKEVLNSVTLLVMPIIVGSMIFSTEIVTVLFGRGAFDITAINLTSTALFYYSPGMIGIGVREVLSRAFYSMHDTKTPMINAAVGMILNIILNIVLSRYLGVGGLALATSIAAIFTTCIMFISLHKKIGSFGIKHISITFLKILVASLIMGLLAKVSFNYLTVSLSQNLSLLLAIAIGALSYFVIIYFMKIEDVEVLVAAVKKKLRR